MRTDDWSDEEVETLKRDWNVGGKTTGQIAAKLGRERGAVSSKVDRLRRAGIYMQERDPRTAHKRTSHRRGSAASPTESKAVAAPTVSGDQRKTLEELTPQCCRWPLGDPLRPDFRFCGKQKVPLLSYCDEHVRVAYAPAAPRRPKAAGAEATPKSDQLEPAN